jgi:beta-phosphoglucomutase-like phosphatase (HAD superfamily)
LFDTDRRFSAEDSLAEPTSKPDPAVYVHAGAALRVGPAHAVAVEDSVNGARSAVAAGYPTIGILQFVPGADRPARAQALQEAGVAAVVESWADAERLLR